jgi:hypothetical protein
MISEIKDGFYTSILQSPKKCAVVMIQNSIKMVEEKEVIPNRSNVTPFAEGKRESGRSKEL